MELGKRGRWCVLIAEDRKAQEHSTASLRIGSSFLGNLVFQAVE